MSWCINLTKRDAPLPQALLVQIRLGVSACMTSLGGLPFHRLQIGQRITSMVTLELDKHSRCAEFTTAIGLVSNYDGYNDTPHPGFDCREHSITINCTWCRCLLTKLMMLTFKFSANH